MFKYISFIIYTIFCIALGFTLSKYSDMFYKSGVEIYADTNLISKYENQIKRDTVIKFIDRIFYKQIRPKSIAFQKADSVFNTKIKNLDVMLDIEAKKDSLKIFSMNFESNTLKEYSFPSGLPEFRLVAQNNDIFYTEKRPIFRPNFLLGGGYSYLKRENKNSYYIEALVTLRAFDLIDLNLALNTNMEGTVKLFFRL